ncbi:transporter substrate-binding domain-containing protein [Massilia sp. CCM 9210]|uniref:substrate-binding periplasmic protein n=1 Tax=Massilia scottii TaxID=3057166 RepID=UPI002796852D|nr:transporter substrate-binding domain-containing protein [Massilia sp. CCM 9210]MDQ1813163.1 transporter substrate-binding domain-containing protein [Massilia sp. CCM 9210]
MKIGFLLLSSLFSCALVLPARGADLVFGVSTGSAMPMTRFHQDELTGGLLKDVGDALASELNVRPRYLTLPRKRVEAALENGTVDLLCDLRPEWLDGKRWQWSDTVFSNKQIIVGRVDTPPLATLRELAGARTGTITGYRYPALERELGRQFVRDDTASDDLNLRKLLRRRFDYMLTNSLYYDYQRRAHAERVRLSRTALTVEHFDTYCALPPSGKLTLAQVNRALLALRKNGKMQAILESYQPAN